MSSERGSVSVVAAAVVSALLVLALGAADLARVLIVAAQAQAAADLAALAAVQELAVPGDAEPTQLARDYAERNGATLLGCECDAGGSEAVVEVAIPVGALLLFADDREVRARARAVVDLPT